jgi:hypothetical protein
MRKPCPLYPQKRTFDDRQKGLHNGRGPLVAFEFDGLRRLSIFANAFRPNIPELAWRDFHLLSRYFCRERAQLKICDFLREHVEGFVRQINLFHRSTPNDAHDCAGT